MEGRERGKRTEGKIERRGRADKGTEGKGMGGKGRRVVERIGWSRGQEIVGRNRRSSFSAFLHKKGWRRVVSLSNNHHLPLL